MNKSLTIEGLSKSFFGVLVLKSLNLSILPGQVLGLVGENGAGKSTLVNIISGHLPADSGTMRLGDEPYAPASAREAQDAGIGLVHQELNLFPNLSIAENLFLTNAPATVGWVHRRTMHREASRQMRRVGLTVSPTMSVGRLSAGQRQLVELARVLAADSRVVLLDEPTTSLSDRESETFYQLVRELAESGHAVVLITHAINDVIQHCDQVAVLRDGELVQNSPTGDVDARSIIQQMVGRPINQLFPDRPLRDSAADAPVLLSVDHVSQPRVVSKISFNIHAGEVVGLFGLMGAGRSELARILMGIDPCQSGSVRLRGATLSGGPRRRIAGGFGLVTESRRDDGVLPESSVAENMTLAALRHFAQPASGRLQRRRMDEDVSSMRQSVRLQPHLSDHQAMKTLSGGNQQKAILGKWLLNDPRVLILDEPTRGIDVGARFEIYQLIHSLAAQGRGILAISSDVEELIGVCDRILVMSLGRMTGEFSRAGFDRERIVEAAFVEHLRDPVAKGVG